MRLTLIACQVFTRELSWVVARSLRTVDVVWLPKTIHDGAREVMLATVQAAVDRCTPATGEAVVIGFGLCGLGIDGLRARDLPLVVPRAHDCRALFLGGPDAAETFTREHPGTYLYTSGWLERGAGRPGMQGWGTGLPGWAELVARYGEDNAAYLLETLDPRRHYHHCCHVPMGCGWDAPFRDQAAAVARDCGWGFSERAGDMAFLTRLVDGPWEHPDLLVVPPGQRLQATHDQRIITAVAGD